MKPDSLITKYRPTKFEEVIGQADVVRSFKASLKERTSHAFLFTGPKAGIGKTTLARIGASYLGAGPGSITEIDAATYSSADDMRDLTATLSFRPIGKNACKVFIVDECFSPDHELLTKGGWKPISEVLIDDEVMAFDGASEECRFEKVFRVVNRPNYCGELVNIKARSFHTLTTPNHEQPVRYILDGDTKRIKVSDLSREFLPVSGKLPSRGLKLTVFERLKIAFEADGHCYYTDKKGVNLYGFAFRRQRKIERLTGFLYELNLAFKQRVNSRGDTVISFRTEIKLEKDLLWFNPTECLDRNNDFLLELVCWDGSYDHRKGYVEKCNFEHKDEKTADMVQLAAQLAGHSSSINVYNYYQSGSPKWRVCWNFTTKVWVQVLRNANISTIPYDGRVYCVSVPSGNVLTRIGKIISISGNCHVLSQTAWKALLKHVEEPPAWGYWFFCTTDLGKVPDTITSRCACYRLKEVARKELIDFLDEIVELEGFTTPSDIVQLCATSADGSPRRALSNLAVCYGAKNRAEAASLIADDEVKDGGAGFELAKALSLGWTWTKIQPILAKIKDDGESPESVRHTVRSYFATVIVGQKDEKAVCKALKVLENFSDPFVPTDGISPIVLAVGRSIF